MQTRHSIIYQRHPSGLFPLQNPSAAKTSLVVVAAANAFEALKTPDIPSTTSTLKILLPFLWAYNHKAINTVPTALATSVSTTSHYKTLHTLHISNPTSPFHPPTPARSIIFDRTSDSSVLEQINGKLGQMVQTAIKANSAVPTKQAKGKFENRLNTEFQALILTALASHSAEVTTEPCDTTRAFFEQKNAAAAKASLRRNLEIEENLPIHIPAGLSTAVRSGVLFWDSTECPSNFSFFLVPVRSSSMVSDTADIIAL